MNRSEYMAALRQALSGLPDEERASALRYYEEYFDDAGPENERQAAANLGDPQKVAAQILEEYRELATLPGRSSGASDGRANAAGAAPAAPKKGWRGISPAVLVVLAVIGALFVAPVGAGLIAAAAGVLIGVLAVILAAAVVLAVVPLCLLIAGVALCGLSFVLWAVPASAVATLGAGLLLLSLGVLAALVLIKLIPPVFRCIVAILRWPFDRLRGSVKK